MGKKRKLNTDESRNQEGLNSSLGDAFSSLNSLGGLELSQSPVEEGLVEESIPAGAHFSGRILLRREKAHRGGKTVVVAYDFPDVITEDELTQLAKDVRKFCGAGGSVQRDTIEVQGDQPAKVAEFFRSKGFKVGGVTN